MKKKIVVAISGASGSIYGIRLLKALLNTSIDLYLVISNTGLKVIEHETGHRPGSTPESIRTFLLHQGIIINKNARLAIFQGDNFFAPMASGSFLHDGMIIAPCSMKTLGAIASGVTDNLISRSADVCLKEERPLILLTRETPLNRIHLKNMYTAAVAGATIMPPSPGFYFKPETVDDLIDSVVARVLDHLKLHHNLFPRWGEEDSV